MIFLSIIDTDTGKTLRFASCDVKDEYVWHKWITADLTTAAPQGVKWQAEGRSPQGRPATEYSIRAMGAHPSEPTIKVLGSKPLAAATRTSVPSVSACVSRLKRWSPELPDFLPTANIGKFVVWRTFDEEQMTRFRTKLD